MKRILSLLTLSVALQMVAAQGTDSFRNPVIAGYHPDPSVCRVGDTFLLVNSSFCAFPGVPLYESKDLVNWTLRGNILTRESQLPLSGASSWLGIYAPTIRYNDGTYYMITTNVGNGGNFLVTSTDLDTWSEPLWLEQQGIDPSLFFENGKVYMCSNPGDAIWLCEIDPSTGKQLTESRQLWQGDGGRYPEGPHIYKRGDYYYLLISEGGTELAHSITIARSRDIYGPYESNPANPILTNCNRRGQSSQVQGTGHGDLVEAANGSWWMVFLAYRNMGGSYHHLGRETFLAPVEWNADGWPVVNGGQPIDTLTSANLLPQTAPAAPLTEGFANDQLGPQYVYLQNPIAANYVLQGGTLTMKAHGSLAQNQQPSFIGRRQEAAHATMQVDVETQGAEAGLAVYQIHDGYYDFSLVPSGRKQYAVQLRVRLKSLDVVVASQEVGSSRASLRITTDGELYHFLYRTDGGEWLELAAQNCSLLSTEVAGGFTGVIVGMATQGEGSAKFSNFTYQEQKK